MTLESGITVPAGAVLVVPLHLVQMDNSRWGSDAGQFNPQRFLGKDVHLGGMVHYLLVHIHTICCCPAIGDIFLHI